MLPARPSPVRPGLRHEHLGAGQGNSDYGKQYTVKVDVDRIRRQDRHRTTSFTTMAAPSKTIRFQSWFADNQVLGVAAPLVFKLTGPGVSSKADRAAVQKRLTVETTPKQAGSWYWFSNTELHYRSEGPLAARHEDQRRTPRPAASPMGDGYFGRSDLTLDAEHHRQSR